MLHDILSEDESDTNSSTDTDSESEHDDQLVDYDDDNSGLY